LKRNRTPILLLFSVVTFALVIFGAQLQVPVALALPSFASFNASAPTANTCAVSGCHTGTVSANPAVITLPAGVTTYTPGGPAIPISVTVPGTSFQTWGFQLSARLASNLASQGGNFNAGDNGTTQGSGSSSTFSFNWTPPPAGTTDTVNFYLTGDNTSSVGGSNLFSTGMATLKPAVAAVADFSLSASPNSLTIAQGASGSSTITTTAQNGFTGGVTLAASGMPSGVTASIVSGKLTLTASSTAATGTSTVTITGTSGSLTHTTTVSLTVSATASAPVPDFSLSASPSSLTITQGASGSSTITTTAQNGFTGSVTLSPSGMPSGVTAAIVSGKLTLTASSTAATGNSLVTITGTSGSLLHTLTLILTVNGTATGGTGKLSATPASLTFTYQMGGRSPASQMLAINNTGGSTSYNATETDPWLSIAPTSGTSGPGNPGSIRASVNPAGMTPGSYGAQINISTPNGSTTTVSVGLIITSGSGGGGEGGSTRGGIYARPYVSDTQSGTLAASWVDDLGATPHNPSDPHNRGLVIAKSPTAPADGLAGATIQNVTGMNLTEVGFDLRAGVLCGADSAQFLVITTDKVTHMLGGCTSTTTTTTSTAAISAPAGWTHLQFDPDKATPPINSQVQSISIVLGKGSTSTGGIAVIDNIEINGVPVGKDSTSTSRPRDD
jgi:Viral BACON domain